MNSDLRQVFSFNRGERTAIVIVLMMLAGVIAYPYLQERRLSNSNSEWTQYLKEIAAFESGLKRQADSMQIARELDFQQMDRSMAQLKITPFPFNPNNLPASEWSRMGLSDRQIRVIKNYEAKGGKFYTKDDVRKIYCITPSEFSVMEPYIIIPERKPIYEETARNIATTPKTAKTKILVNLNTADSAALTSLYGIGPSFARRIIKYRKLLGGFYSKQQLLEVYGFDQDKLDQVNNYITLNTSDITKINLNSASTDMLKKHPYFDYFTAKAIVDRRISKGKFTSIEQLKEIPVIHDEMFEKIRFYVATE